METNVFEWNAYEKPWKGYFTEIMHSSKECRGIVKEPTRFSRF